MPRINPENRAHAAMDPVEVVRRRLAAQRLLGTPYDSPAEAVAGLGAVQSQEYDQARWALAQRSGHPTAAAVEEAFVAGEFLRTHVLRPTWHFVAAEDLGWLLRLTGPRLEKGGAGRLHQLGVTDAQVERAGEVAEAAIAADGPLTRPELRARLAEEGLETDASQAGHIIFHLELRALLCSGPPKGAKQTYALVADRTRGGRDLAGDEALAELVRRYFKSHGPATAADFTWWSGLTLTMARRGLELCGDEFDAVEGDDGRTWHVDAAATDPGPVPGALMFGSFDEIKVAFRDLRTVSVTGAPGRTLILRPVFLDGRLAGIWKRAIVGDGVRVEFTVSGTLGLAEEEALRAEAERYGAHVGRPAEVVIAEGDLRAAA